MSFQIVDVAASPIQACAAISANGYHISLSTVFAPASLMVFDPGSRGCNQDIFGVPENVAPSAENIQKALNWCLAQS